MSAEKRQPDARLLDRFQREQRGIGTHADYTAWRQVRRCDAPSRGRSHLHVFGGRQVDLMSDLELAGFLFATQMPDLLDLREHFPLARQAAPHELWTYDVRFAAATCRGSVQLARELRVRHPTRQGPAGPVADVLVTHQLLTLTGRPSPTLLAVSYRRRFNGWRSPKLSIEAGYWAERSVQWLLVTDKELPASISLTLRRAACWALGPPARPEDIERAATIATSAAGRSLSWVLSVLARELGGLDVANHAFWQAVWQGHVPLDLRRGWRPQSPLEFLSPEAWSWQNPLRAGRSAWI